MMEEGLHHTALGDVLREHARSYPNKIAVVCGEERYTYAQLNDRVNLAAYMLRTVMVRPGDRVLWIGQNCHRLLETLLACAKINAVFCPANWRQSAEEINFI